MIVEIKCKSKYFGSSYFSKCKIKKSESTIIKIEVRK
jgi:hypothetical protein